MKCQFQIYTNFARYNPFPVGWKFIISGKIDEVTLIFLGAITQPTFAPICIALPGYSKTTLAMFFVTMGPFQQETQGSHLEILLLLCYH